LKTRREEKLAVIKTQAGNGSLGKDKYEKKNRNDLFN
jgi:hypothetical protein